MVQILFCGGEDGDVEYDDPTNCISSMLPNVDPDDPDAWPDGPPPDTVSTISGEGDPLTKTSGDAHPIRFVWDEDEL